MVQQKNWNKRKPLKFKLNVKLKDCNKKMNHTNNYYNNTALKLEMLRNKCNFCKLLTNN